MRSVAAKEITQKNAKNRDVTMRIEKTVVRKTRTLFTSLTNPLSPQLRAFEKLLQDYPEWIGNVVMIQVTSPALTDSPKLERMVSEASS